MLNLKLLLLSILVLLPVGTVASYDSDRLIFGWKKDYLRALDDFDGEKCFDGEYYDAELNRCFDCTECSEFMFELNTCTKTQNTLCGWCGNAGPVESMPNDVLMSYQNNCLMTRLKFVNMKKLEEKITDDEWNNSQEEADVLEEDEEEKEEEEEEEDPFERFETDFFKKAVAERVSQYVNLRKAMNSQIIGARVDENDVDGLFEIPMKKVYTREEVEQFIKENEKMGKLFKPENFVEEDDDNEDDDASIEEPIELESNEKLAKWDDWVDDRVKPLDIQKIKLITLKWRPLEAEPINDNREDKVIVLSPEAPEEEPLPEQYEMETSYITKKVEFWPRFICLMVLFGGIFLILLRMTIRRRRTFRVLELHPEDYKILQTCGQNAEEKNHDNHIHENPLYLP